MKASAKKHREQYFRTQIERFAVALRHSCAELAASQTSDEGNYRCAKAINAAIELRDARDSLLELEGINEPDEEADYDFMEIKGIVTTIIKDGKDKWA